MPTAPDIQQPKDVKVNDYIAGQCNPWYRQRFWLKVRSLPDGFNEIYCPWYAIPLDWLHRIVFKSNHLPIIK